MNPETVLKQAIALAPRVKAITEEVLTRHIGRGDVATATWLSLVSGRPVFFLGSPGVDKTGTIQDLARRIESALFYDALMPTVVSVEQLLVESTSIVEEPTVNGGKAIRTHDELGRAAAAHLLFADEIWKAEPRVLQTVLDLAKGDGVRHEGQQVTTPLLSFLAASNELPEPEGNLGALWSRMTLRVVVNPLDRAGKQALVASRLARYREAVTQLAPSEAEGLTLEDVWLLREARPFVEIPKTIVETVLDILQQLVEDESSDFNWAWADDRRFGRIFDILQAHALLQGRDTANKADLVVLEWLLWDTPEQIPAVKAAIAPYTRTALTEAQEFVDVLLTPGGFVQQLLDGDLRKGPEALSQVNKTSEGLKALKAQASDRAMADKIELLLMEVEETMNKVIAVATGQQPRSASAAASVDKGGN